VLFIILKVVAIFSMPRAYLLSYYNFYLKDVIHNAFLISLNDFL